MWRSLDHLEEGHQRYNQWKLDDKDVSIPSCCIKDEDWIKLSTLLWLQLVMKHLQIWIILLLQTITTCSYFIHDLKILEVPSPMRFLGTQFKLQYGLPSIKKGMGCHTGSSFIGIEPIGLLSPRVDHDYHSERWLPIITKVEQPFLSGTGKSSMMHFKWNQDGYVDRYSIHFSFPEYFLFIYSLEMLRYEFGGWQL